LRQPEVTLLLLEGASAALLLAELDAVGKERALRCSYRAAAWMRTEKMAVRELLLLLCCV
jgi:hypothetical protein